MSNFTKDEQTQIVTQAMELEKAIIDGNEKLSELKRQRFKAAPSEPKRQTVDMNVKPVEPDYSALPSVNLTFTDYLDEEIKTNPNLLNKLFSAHPIKRGLIATAICFALMMILMPICASVRFLMVLLIPVGFIGSCGILITLVYYFVKRSAYSKKVTELTNDLKAQPDYQQMKGEAERIAQEKTDAIIADLKKQQAEFDKQYADEKQHYDTVVIPEYEKEKSDWIAAHEQEIRAISDKLNADKKAQDYLYRSSKIIPMQYQNIGALKYISQMMSTSDYDIKEAINMYDKEIQRQQEMLRLQEQKKANALQAHAIQLADEQNQLAYEQNALLDEQNAISERARENANTAAIIGTIQRHNTNKALKNMRRK